MRRALGCLVAVCLLAACEPHLGEFPTRADRERLAPLSTSPPALRQFVAGTTHKSYSREHGTQIEHLAADGRSFLLYPGNRAIVPGRWDARSYVAPATGETVATLCFLYPRNSYNPVLDLPGGEWRCSNADGYLMNTDEIVPGDPLGLASSRVPTVLPPTSDVSIARTADRAGIATELGPNLVSWD